jgi:hypothetical protein
LTSPGCRSGHYQTRVYPAPESPQALGFAPQSLHHPCWCAYSGHLLLGAPTSSQTAYAIKYEAFLCSLQCGGCGRCLTCNGLHQPPQQVHGEPSDRNVGCSAPTSLASIMVIGPHHAAVIHVGGSSEVGQREHMVRQLHKCWSEFLCLGSYLAPPRQVGGVFPRDALGRHPSADRRRWRPAGLGSVA